MNQLKICDTCHNGIGLVTYKCEAVMPDKEFCTSDCYADGLSDTYGLNILKGRFTLKTTREGIELV